MIAVDCLLHDYTINVEVSARIANSLPSKAELNLP